MKKMFKLLLATAIFTIALGGAALAAFNGGTHALYNGGARLHGDFGTNTSGCAGCHVTHYAEAQKLLKTGPTQTAFCTSCHGGVSSPYDVLNGKIQADVKPADDWSAGNVADSYAGGFLFAGKHNVEDNATAGSGTANIPASENEVFGGLKCASCHNPHKGGVLPRLLRTDLPASAALTTGTVTVATPGMTIDGATNLPTSYDSGFTAWCGGCHDRFNKSDNSGHSKGADAYYRHAMDVTPPNLGAIGQSMATGTPLEANKVTCITCHRAHGSNATVSGEAASFFNQDDGKTVTGNVLLRMDDRDVCYNCHGAAQYNLSNGTY